MAVDAGSLTPFKTVREGLGVRLRAVAAPAVLAGMIAASVAARVAAAIPHSTPSYFPDEYIYAALARSLAHGHLTIRGTSAHFPALLEPLLAAPLTLVGNIDTTYHLTQGMHAIAMSLAAIPIYLLARRLGLPSWQQLACAALTLALPEFVYTSYITADALALPLALGAVYAGVVALERPTRLTQTGFLGLSALATFDRVQYVVLPVAFFLAALFVTHGHLREAIARYRMTLLAVAASTAVVLALGPSRALGYYHGVLDLGVSPQTVAHWIAVDAMMLVFACAVVTVPAAVAGLGLALVRPKTSVERTFAALAAALAALLLVELGVYAASGSARFQGRYLEALPPLVPVLFCLGMQRLTSKPSRIAVIGLSFGSLVLAARVPLSGYVVADAKQDSPFLQAVWQVEQHLGVSGGALAVALIAGVLAVVAAIAVQRPRTGSVVALALALSTMVATSALAALYDAQTTQRVLRTYFPSDRAWIDHAHIGRVAILVTPGTARASVSGALFWNASAKRLLQMRGAQDVDAFGASPVRVRRDGALLTGGSPYRGNLLVEEYADSAQLEGARLVSRSVSTALWKSNGIPRLVSLTDNRYFDGWLGWQSSVTVWPGPSGQRIGAVCMTMTMPAGVYATVDLTAPGVHRSVVLPAGSSRRVALPIQTKSPWRLELKARRPIFLADNRLVAAKSSAPRFIAGKASPETCR
jgi:hypothetical protein